MNDLHYIINRTPGQILYEMKTIPEFKGVDVDP